MLFVSLTWSPTLRCNFESNLNVICFKIEEKDVNFCRTEFFTASSLFEVFVLQNTISHSHLVLKHELRPRHKTDKKIKKLIFCDLNWNRFTLRNNFAIATKFVLRGTTVWSSISSDLSPCSNLQRLEGKLECDIARILTLLQDMPHLKKRPPAAEDED